jgi:acetyl-CoA carboxylase carboxyltransferase component
MTEEEMLRFRVSALSMGKKRARIVRERVADLIRPGIVSAAAPRTEPAAPEASGTVADGTVIGSDRMAGPDANSMWQAGQQNGRPPQTDDG